MRVILIVLTGLFFLTGCVTSSGVAEFTTYKSVFDDSAAVTTAIIDQLAVSERAVEQRARLHPNSVGIDTEFRPGDASVFSDLADPPLAAQYRSALALVNQYNKIMLGYATGQGFAQLEAEIFGLAREAGATAEVISGSTSLVQGLTPYLGVLKEISGFALSGRSRAVFRERALLYHDDIIGILKTMRDGSAEIFPNLTFNIKRDILTAVGDGRDPQPLREKHRKVRVLLSDWVVMMDKNISALNAVKMAVENPSPGSRLSGATREIIELRSVVDGVRKHLAELNAQ